MSMGCKCENRSTSGPPSDLQHICAVAWGSLSDFKGGMMARVVLVGFDPDTVDFSNPALPPGMSAEKVNAGIALALKEMRDRGWEADVCLIRPDETAGQTVERHLAD